MAENLNAQLDESFARFPGRLCVLARMAEQLLLLEPHGLRRRAPASRGGVEVAVEDGVPRVHPVPVLIAARVVEPRVGRVEVRDEMECGPRHVEPLAARSPEATGRL